MWFWKYNMYFECTVIYFLKSIIQTEANLYENAHPIDKLMAKVKPIAFAFLPWRKIEAMQHKLYSKELDINGSPA